jgi:hypothetical protein
MDTPRDLNKDRWDVLWAAQRSQRYHARRNVFFDRWNKCTAFIGVLGGSAVIASLAQHAPAWLAAAGGLLVVVMSGIDLVVGTGEMARKHNDLRRRFCELEASLARDTSPTESTIADWQATRLAIEADEPPIFVALDLLCENELARAYEHLRDQPRVAIPWYKVMTAQFILWPNS